MLGGGGATATFTQTGTGPAVIVVSADGVTADIEMAVALSVPGLAFDGDLGLELDTAAGYLKVTGTDLDLEVLGQTLRADVTIEQVTGAGGTVVRVGLANATLDLAGVATLSDGTGLLVLTAGGVAAELSARLELASGSPLTLSGRFAPGAEHHRRGRAADAAGRHRLGHASTCRPAPTCACPAPGSSSRSPARASAATSPWSGPAASYASPPATSGCSSATAPARWSGSPTAPPT